MKFRWSQEALEIIDKMSPREKDRLENIVAMHTLVISMNDESAYFRWINLVPDEATEFDFIDLATDDEDKEINHIFDEAVELFKKLWECYAKGNNGLFIGDKCY